MPKSIDNWEADMSPYEQLIFGIAAGLIFCALLRWTPLWRDLLAAIAAAGLLDLLVNDQARRGLDLAAIAARLPGEILGHPHFCLGVAMAFASVLAVLHVLRTR
jgi:hypothetical protein